MRHIVKESKNIVNSSC